MNTDFLNKIIGTQGWLDIPASIVSREDKKISTTGEVWDLPYSIWESTSLDFTKVENEIIRWSLKSYVIDKIIRSSTHAGYSVFQTVYSEIIRSFSTSANIDLKENLIAVFEKQINTARSDHRLWALYRPIHWYLYCAENYSELGFCSAYALELEGMIIPGNPKGEAVRSNNPEKGALHRTLELPLLIAALKSDKSKKVEHLQQKAAMALSISFARNPANLTFLREEDFIDLTPLSSERCYVLRMPRIKKRQMNPRDDYLEEYLDPLYAEYILDLIQKNSEIGVVLEANNKIIPNPKQLFVNSAGNTSALASKDYDHAYNVTSAYITGLLKDFVTRHKIISPITKRPLQITARRLRYTLAVGLAAEGISKKELARILDHSDTQHVLVYFEMAGKIVQHLDKAAAKSFSRYLQFFKGKIIDNDDEAINGNRSDKHIAFIDEDSPKSKEEIGVCGESSLCHLDPPFSCYLCPKFQPYREANHEHVLECLLKNRTTRMEKYEDARLGIQLDDVIAAVAQVTELCGEKI